MLKDHVKMAENALTTRVDTLANVHLALLERTANEVSEKVRFYYEMASSVCFPIILCGCSLVQLFVLDIVIHSYPVNHTIPSINCTTGSENHWVYVI